VCEEGSAADFSLLKRISAALLSTLNHDLAYCYDAGRAIEFVLIRALHGLQETTGLKIESMLA
jgi:hypothetical protein